MEAIEIKKRNIPENIDLVIVSNKLMIRHSWDGFLYSLDKTIEFFDEYDDDEIKNFEKFDVDSLNDEEFNNLEKIINDFINYKNSEIKASEMADVFYSNKLSSNLINTIHRQRHKEVYDKMDYIEKIARSIYDDNVRMILEDSKAFSCCINFPSVTISNSAGDSRELHNLVVKMNFKLDKDKLVMNHSLQGCRLTLSDTEANEGYHHSHLSRTKIFSFSSFCLGDTAVKTTLIELCIEFNEETFELFLHMLKNYVSHESLEGGPFIRMSTIGPRGRNFSVPTVVYTNILLDRFINKLRNYRLNYDSEDNIFYILNSEDLEKEIIHNLSELSIDKSLYMVNKIDGCDSEYVLNTISTERPEIEFSTTPEVENIANAFGIKPEIVEDNKDNFKIKEQLSDKIIDSVRSNLSQRINKYFIEKYGPCGF